MGFIFRLTLLLVLMQLTSPGVRAVALRDGESLTYRIGWGLFHHAADIKITAARGADGIQVTTTTETRGFIKALYPFSGTAELNFDPADRLTLAVARTYTKRRDTHASLALDYSAARATYTDHLRPERSADLPLPPGQPLDFITSLVQARAWDLAVGQSHPALVVFDDDFYQLTITAEAVETISTPQGNLPALRLVPTMVGEPRGLFRRGGRVAVWISADEARLPVRFEVAVAVGTATATLVDYSPPLNRRNASPPAADETATAKPPTPALHKRPPRGGRR